MKRLFLNLIGMIFLVLIFTCAFVNDGLKSSEGAHFSNRVAVLTYHHIDPEASAFTITPETFKQHLLALKVNHYHVISMQDFIEFQDGRRSLPSDAVVITFDDGYESFYRYAYPILKEQNMVATNFIIVSYLGTNPGIPFLNWSEIQQMKNDGFSFYSHTYNAHDFAPDQNGMPVDPLTNPIYLKNSNRMENEEEYEQRVKADLLKADQIILSKLGTHDKLFCLPHGRYNQKLLDLGNQVGIEYFFTGMDGLNTSGTKLVKRINAGSANVTPEKLLHKLNDETNLFGKLKITIKNYLVSQRMSE